MDSIIGKKNSFAVEIEILKVQPQLWGRTAIWLNSCRIGDFNDENILAPFINSLSRIALSSDKFWEEDFAGKSCKDILLAISPFFYNPEDFFDLSNEEQERLQKFDKYLFQWGENFDAWAIYVVVKDTVCKFLWVKIQKENEDLNVHGHSIQCFEVPLLEVRDVYKQLCDIIPNECWPSFMKKI